MFPWRFTSEEQNVVEMAIWLLGQSYARNCGFALIMDHILCRMAAAILQGHSQASGEEAGLSPKPAPTCLPCQGAVLDVDPSALVRLSDACSHIWCLDCGLMKKPERNHPVNFSQIPDPQKPCKTGNVYCGF